MDKTLSLSETKMKLNRLIDDVSGKGDEIVITKNGQRAAVLVPTELYDSWKETQEILTDSDFVSDIAAGLKRLKKATKSYSFKEVFGEKL